MNKPDNVADNPSILPYGSNIGAPAISKENIEGWKVTKLDKINKQLLQRYTELNNQMNNLINDYETNQLVYSAKFNFEPVIGEVYHLYEGSNGENFLSLIHPSEWNRKNIGSFKLDSDNKWIKID